MIVWDLSEGRAIETLEGHREEVWDQVFSPDGRTLYTASDDSTVRIWDLAGYRRLGRPFRTNAVNDTGEPPRPPSPSAPTGARSRSRGSTAGWT